MLLRIIKFNTKQFSLLIEKQHGILIMHFISANSHESPWKCEREKITPYRLFLALTAMSEMLQIPVFQTAYYSFFCNSLFAIFQSILQKTLSSILKVMYWGCRQIKVNWYIFSETVTKHYGKLC